MRDKKQFAQRITALSALFDREISEAVIEMYWVALMPYDDEETERAFQEAARRCKFFPKPAELIEFIEGSSEGREALAWHALLTGIARVGSWSSVRFSDPAIHSVVETWGGWISGMLHDHEGSSVPGEGLQGTLPHALVGGIRHQEYLAGRTEFDNRKRGYLDRIPEAEGRGDRGRQNRYPGPGPASQAGGTAGDPGGNAWMMFAWKPNLLRERGTIMDQKQQQEEFDIFAYVELFGHQCIAGRVTTQDVRFEHVLPGQRHPW